MKIEDSRENIALPVSVWRPRLRTTEIEYCVACFSVEVQRDEAVQNLLEAQTSLEDFQRRSHERMKAVSVDEG